MTKQERKVVIKEIKYYIKAINELRHNQNTKSNCDYVDLISNTDTSNNP